MLGTIAAVVTFCVVTVSAIVALADPQAADGAVTWRPGRGTPQVPPSADAAAEKWTEWAHRTIQQSLTEQASAMLAGDETGFLAPVDPANPTLVGEHRRRFTVLRAMGLGVWTETSDAKLTSAGDRAWKVDIRISYCFGAATCRAVTLPMGSSWRLKNDRLVMVGLELSDPDWNGPRPWEVDDLTVRRGDRVVVASTKANAWRLSDAVVAADRAAMVADKFAKWEDAPGRYVIFLAGPADWKKWYGHAQPEWAAAWAVPVSSTVTEVVVRTQVVRQSGLESLLTHELAHVTSLAGNRDGKASDVWWLIEGIAEYAMMLDQPVRAYDALAPTRSFVDGKWNGDPAVAAPSDRASISEAAARYGVAFLAVHRLADKYGMARMLDFWGRVVHDDESLDAAAQSALGVSWRTAKADCARYIRSVT